MKSLFLLFLIISQGALANLHLAPPDFTTKESRAIYVDFQTASYNIDYNVLWKRTTVRSQIRFIATKTGSPVFDLIPTVKKVILDGAEVGVTETTAPDGSLLKKITAIVEPGEHTLEIENSFSENVRYHLIRRQVSSAFWIRDLKYRMFLEQYVPSNFEFDQYKMTINVKFSGTKVAKQDIYTNGVVIKTSPNSYQITFPDYFTVSCPYFHTTPRGQKKRIDFSYQSVDGRFLPVTVYTSWWSHPSKFKNEAIKIFKELEADYGPWGRPSFVAYETIPGTGGMEHAGATQTSFAALDHEMLHSYFAKGVMPANGNAGWIDEAIASWRDFGYQRKPRPGFSGSNLGKGSVYQRNTDPRAYAIGREFMSYLDYRLQNMGGLKAFLRGYFQTYKHTVVTQEHFKNNLEFFSGLDLSDDFNTYIWGENADTEGMNESSPAHRSVTKNDLLSIL
jgi:hypothetical protein